MWEVYFPWPITVEICQIFNVFFILENVGKINNVKKRKKDVFTSMIQVHSRRSSLFLLLDRLYPVSGCCNNVSIFHHFRDIGI